MEEIVIPDLDDDDDLALPPFSRHGFGVTSTSSDTDLYTHRNDVSISSDASHGGRPTPPHPQITPTRPPISKSSSSYTPTSSHGGYGGGSSGFGVDPLLEKLERPRLGKLSNGSASSLVAHSMTPTSSSGGIFGARKGSFASLKNAFKSGAGSHAVPPVPTLDTRQYGAPGYPALRNPFSRFDTPPSPTASFRPRAGTVGSMKQSASSPAPSAYHTYGDRKQSIATTHSSQRSHGGRSATSQGSSNFRAEDYPLPALPRIPARSAQSRAVRNGSDTSLFVVARTNGVGGEGEIGDGFGFGRTPAEEALRVVFREFRELADQKINKLLAKPLNSQVSLAASFDADVDPTFDGLILSLSNCARTHSRRVVDLLTAWCKSQCEAIQAAEVRAHLSRSMGLQIRVEDAAAVLSNRKTSAAVYVYNRALIELVRIVPRESLGDDVALNLEQTAFNLYRNEKPDEYPHRNNNSSLLVKLLGELSKTRFLSVSDRFTRELGALGSVSSKDSEAKVEHLLRGMRLLKLKVYPEEDLEIASEFLETLAAFFASAHGNALKSCFAETLTQLLYPVVETATAEVNHPVWSRAVATILQRASGMSMKPRYWPVAFPLVVIALSVSPREVFMEHWQSCVDTVSSKSKDRATRTVSMNAFLRLLWVYLNRCPESSTSTRKRLEVLLRNHFPAHTPLLLPADLPLEPFVAILHYVMVRQFDYGQDLVVDFLRDSVPLRTPDGMPGDVLHPERAYVAVRAAAYTIGTMQDDLPALFPKSSDFTHFDLEFKSSGETVHELAEVEDFVKRCGPMVINVLLSCDRTVGSLLLSNDTITLSAHASSSSWEGSSEHVTRKHGDVHVAYSARHEPVFRVLTAILDALPCLLPPSHNVQQLVNILCRTTFSADIATCESASAAMHRMIRDPAVCPILVDSYRQFVFETRHVFRDQFVGTRLLESQLVRVVRLWVDMLEALVAFRRSGEVSDGVDATAVSNVESCAMFLLCSSSVNLRRLAHPIFAAARDLAGLERRPSAPFRYSRFAPDKAAVSSVLQMYEANVDEADLAALRRLPSLTSNDRHRLDAIKGPKLLQKIAESDSPKDNALWASILPTFIVKVGDQLPSPVTQLCALLALTVVRLQSHVSLVASGRSARQNLAVSRSTSDTSVLADQWRLYLSVLCATMTTTQASPLPRKDAALTVETVPTPALFGYLVNLLTSEDRRFQDAAVYSLGSIRQASLRPLAEILLNFVRRLADGYKAAPASMSSSMSGSGPSRRPSQHGILWTAAAHVFRLISPLILDAHPQSHLANLSSLIGFVKVTYALLADRVVKDDYELQSLRRWFCVVVDYLTGALGKLDSSERFLGEDVRGAIFKLCYEWCYVGRRPDVAKARESHTLQAAADSYRGDRDRAQYLDDLQAKTKLLSVAAAEAMAGLCQGKLISVSEATPEQQASDHIVEPLTVLRWIRGMFSSTQSSHHEIGRRALQALIKHNWGVVRLADEVLHQSFGEGEQFSLESSFFGVLADLLNEGTIKLPPEQLACLSLSKLGHPVPDVRQRAFQLAVWLLDDAADRLAAAPLLPAVGSGAANVYRHAQRVMSTRLANLHPNLALPFLSECATRLSQLEAPRRQATLSILPAWLAVLELEADTSQLGPDEVALEHQALSNLMYLVIRFSGDHLDSIREIFVSFAGSGKSRNTTALVKFLFEQGAKRRSADFVIHAQQVMACLAASPAGDIVFDEICGFVQPSDMATTAQADVPPSPMTSLANLDALFSAPSSRSQPLSQGQMALLFAGELLPHRLGDVTLSSRLPTLLHVAFIHCDDPNASLREQAQTVLFQVLRAWVCDVSSVATADHLDDRAAIWAAAELKTTMLARTRSSAFWKADDLGGRSADSKATSTGNGNGGELRESETFLHAPAKMATLIAKIIGILQHLQPRLRQQWGELALVWATSCTIRHLACRSFQVFRILSPAVSPRMISDVLARLSSTMASSSPEIQTFNTEVLRTFSSIVQSLTPGDMRAYPQIFWCSMACLTTPYESEFNEVIDLLSHLLDKTNLADPVIVSQLVSFRPQDWVGPPPHLQALLLIGLRSAKTDMMTFDVLRRLTSVTDSELIDAPRDRLLHGFVAALPWMLHSTDLGEPNYELAGMAQDLADIAERQGEASFARLLTSFARARFRTKDDFIRQAAALLRDNLGTQALEIVTLLLGFVLNQNDWMRDKALQVLKLVLAFPESRAPLAAHSHELVRPLLALLSSKHAALALSVLDLPLGSGGTGETVPDAEDAVFGPIESSGWSVPNALERSEVTRANVHAVFNTCAIETRAASAHFSVVQFADLRGIAGLASVGGTTGEGGIGNAHETLGLLSGGVRVGWGASQISLDLPSPPMSSDNASMGDIVGALHSLNQFFDEGLDITSGTTGGGGVAISPRAPRRSTAHMAHYTRGSSSESLAESRIRAIMSRTTMRSPSLTSPIYETDYDETMGISLESRLGHGHGGQHDTSEPRVVRNRHGHTTSDALTSTDSIASSLEATESGGGSVVGMSSSTGVAMVSGGSSGEAGMIRREESGTSLAQPSDAIYFAPPTNLPQNDRLNRHNHQYSRDDNHYSHHNHGSVISDSQSPSRNRGLYEQYSANQRYHATQQSVSSESDFTENVFGLDEEPGNDSTATAATLGNNGSISGV